MGEGARPASGPASGPDIACTGLSKVFGGERGEAVPAVAPFDATFRGGRTTALVGPSGCGKSTLLRLVAGLDEPSAGSVLIGGETPEETRRRAGLAVAFQDAALLPWRTVRGNVALALTLARRPPDPSGVEALIDLVGLSGFADRRPAELSGGMRQRAAIARCLVGAPELLLLDEPFGAVDALTRRRLNADLPALWQARGTTALLVTHSIEEAVLVSDRVLVLSPRPARVVADVEVPLAHPRGEGARRSAEFRDLCDDVAEALAAGVADASPAVAAQ
jgi:NitT/TauT family transport system ATP-binding protein